LLTYKASGVCPDILGANLQETLAIILQTYSYTTYANVHTIKAVMLCQQCIDCYVEEKPDSLVGKELHVAVLPAAIQINY